MPRDLQDADTLFTIAVFTKPNRHRSAPAIRGIPKGTQKQRNVIVLLVVLHLKHDDDLRVQTLNLPGSKMGTGVEDQAIGSCGHSFLSGPIAQTAVGVGCAPRYFCPLPADGLPFKDYRNICGRAAQRYVKDMRGNVAHSSSNFSRRRRVISRCSSAAIRNSASGSFGSRWRRAFRISSLRLPVAQIKKT